MALLIVGLTPEPSCDRERDVEPEADPPAEASAVVLDVGDGERIELQAQNVRSADGTSWYWADVADDTLAHELAAKANELPEVASAYVQAPEGPPG